jgi:hypothetical protein
MLYLTTRFTVHLANVAPFQAGNTALNHSIRVLAFVFSAEDKAKVTKEDCRIIASHSDLALFFKTFSNGMNPMSLLNSMMKVCQYVAAVMSSF